LDHLPNKIIFKGTRGEKDPEVLVDFIAQDEKVSKNLSKALIKEAMSQGSCWVRKGNSKLLKRIRRAKTPLWVSDSVEFYFDRELFLKQREELEIKPVMVSQHKKDWSVWNKPAGWLAQGTKYGDSLSLLRFVEKYRNGKEVFLVHRLDKETQGLMLIAHNAKANQGLGKLWATQKVGKLYWAEVLGELENEEGQIDTPIEGKESLTFFKVLERRSGTTLVEVEIKTGRKHQIRKHFLEIGHPVMGDPRYGRGNKNKDGMKLMACCLRFRWGGSPVEVSLTDCPF